MLNSEQHQPSSPSLLPSKRLNLNDNSFSLLNTSTLHSLDEYIPIDEMKPHHDILQMFRDAKQNNTYLRVQAPMVRYSKLAFRLLCLEYNCDVVYTPMIMADSFSKSQKARDSDFSTHVHDKPLVVQFAGMIFILLVLFNNWKAFSLRIL